MPRKPKLHTSNPLLSPEDAFGRVVRGRRLELGLTQADIEDEGMDQSYISKLESGRYQVCLRGILTLATKLQMEPGDLLAATVKRMRE